jgi:tape measure domain-containing protein
MATKGDVELVIRATNQAKSALDSVTQALDALTKSQNTTATSAGATGKQLTELEKDLAGLEAKATALQAFQIIAEQFKVAQLAADRLSQELTRTVASLAQLQESSTAASVQTARLIEQAKLASAAYNEQRAAVLNAKTALSEINSQIRAATQTYTSLGNKVAALKEPNAELNAQLAQQGIALEALKAKQTQFRESLEQERAALQAAGAAQKELQTAVKVSAANQGQLQLATEKASNAAQQQRAAFTQAEAVLAQLAAVAERGSSALGGLAAEEGAVSAAAQRTANDIKAVTQALEAQKAAGSTGTIAQGPAAAALAAYKAQIAALEQTRSAMLAVSAVATQLGQAMAEAAQPSETLARQFILAKQASAEAKQEYLAQVQALNALRGATQGGFAAFAQAEAQLHTLATAEVQATADTHTLGGALLALGRTLVTFGGEASETGGRIGIFRSALQAVTGETRTALGVVERMRGQVLALASGYVGLIGAIQGIGKVVDTIRTVEQAQNRLGAVFHQDSGKVAADMQFLGNQADRLGFDFSVLSDAYTKLAVSASTAGFSSEATRKIFLSVAEAGRVNKVSIDQLRLIFLALEQMINKGTVQSEELKRQLGNELPGAFELFAKAIGATTSELQGMLKAGQVLADETTLLKFAKTLDQTFGPQLNQSLQSVTTSLGRLQNSFFNAAREVADGGFASGLKSFLNELNNFFKSDQGRQFFESIGNALKVLLQGLAVLVEHFQAVGNVIQFLIGLKIAQFFNALFVEVGKASPAFLKFTTAIEASFVSIETLRTAMLTLGVSMKSIGLEIISMPAKLAKFEIATVSVSTVLSRLFIGGINLVRIGLSTLGGIVGGLVGLIASFALQWALLKFLEWAGETKQVNDALTEHAKIMQDVSDATDKASEKSQKFRDALKELTLIELKRHFIELQQQVQGPINALKDLDKQIQKVNSADPRANAEIQELRDLEDRAVQGKLSLDDLSKGLANLAVSLRTPEAIRLASDLEEVVGKLREFRDQGNETSKAIGDLHSGMDGLDKPTVDLQKSFSGLGKSSNEAATGANNAATATANFKAAAIGAGASQTQLAESTAGIWANINASINGAIADISAKLGEITPIGESVWSAFLTAAESALFPIKGIIDGLLSLMNSLIAKAIEAAQAAAGAGSGHSGGGPIRGPGTATSDSILSWLSDGEWVIQAAAVKKYGHALFAALNGMRLPTNFLKFSEGGSVNLADAISGLVPATVSLPNQGPSDRVTVDFKIAGKSIGEMIAPRDVADNLVRFALNQQARSGGRKPNWYLG